MTINIEDVFKDGDNDELAVTATTSDASVVTIMLDGNILSVFEEGVGNTTITLTAKDGKGGTLSSEFAFVVTEKGNQKPTVNAGVEDLLHDQGFATKTILLTDVFTDENGDALIYTVVSSNTSIAKASVSGSVLTITEVLY